MRVVIAVAASGGLTWAIEDLELLYAIVMSVGWAHLVGPMWFGRSRLRRRGPELCLQLCVAAVAVASAPVWTAWLIDTEVPVLWVFYGLGLAHAVENEIQLSSGEPGPVARPARTAWLVAVVMAFSALSGVAIERLYVFVSGAHVSSWILVAARRHATRVPSLVVLHLGGASLGAIALATGHLLLLFDPLVYGAASVLHLAQTAWLRTVDPA